MKDYTFQNTLVSKKQLKDILAWSFTKYGSVQASFLADELKYLGFKYATQAGISISIEDLRVPYVKNLILVKANQQINHAEISSLKGQITDIEKFQKIIDIWSITSESLKDEVVSYFQTYDPLNSVYMMAFSGARGNLSQVRQLVGMRGLMSDPSGQIMNLPIKKNFREGLTITDYLMSGYGARKGIVDTALKTANSGYLTRRLIDVAQDIIIREKNCLTSYSFLYTNLQQQNYFKSSFYNQLLGRLLNKKIYDPKTKKLIADINTEISSGLIQTLSERQVKNFYIRSPLTCCLYRSICQKCYGWNLSKESLIDLGEAVGIIAAQSIGEPGTQLTMRTFHTGGIFTSSATKQLISPIDGIIEFSKFLKTSTIRTNRGENVLLTENSGFLTILFDSENNFQIELPRNTILFIKNNQYIKATTIIGQLAGALKQTLTETKFLFTNISGEVLILNNNQKENSITKNTVLWIFSGQVYQAPINSFLNFYSDYKINKNNYIFRSKCIILESGQITLSKSANSQSEQNITILNNLLMIRNCNINKLYLLEKNLTYILKCKNLIYELETIQNKKLTLLTNNFLTLVTNQFKTLTGGVPYYTKESDRIKNYSSKKQVYVYNKITEINYPSIIWVSEETYQVSYYLRFLLVTNNNFISEKFEIFPNFFSRTRGIVKIIEKNKIVKEINIQPGSLYEVVNVKNIKHFNNQIFYPGELLLNQIEIIQLSIIEVIDTGQSIQLLIRPLDIYEVPLNKSSEKKLGKENALTEVIVIKSSYGFELKNIIKCPYYSNRKIKESDSLNLIVDSLNLKIYQNQRCFETQKFFGDSLDLITQKPTERNLKLAMRVNPQKNLLSIIAVQEVLLASYIPTNLKYSQVNLSLIVKNGQFVSPYTTLGYFQFVTNKSLEVVKFKLKKSQKKQIFLISNDDCITIPKNKIKTKTINELFINPEYIFESGKIIIDNLKTVTIQKGRPYFFPNCKNDRFLNKNTLDCTLITKNIISFKKQLIYKYPVNINYYDITKKLSSVSVLENTNFQYSFSKMIFKKQGKFYISGVPRIITNSKTNPSRIGPDLKTNQLRHITNGSVSYPISQIGIHSVTEDLFEKEVNIVYCRNAEFVEAGETLGLLNFEKEITGDIVKGLPRIQELLEARKKKKFSKRIPKNQKKSLLIRKTTLDPSFEFRKLATTIKTNEKINPHNLLKLYFNYYAKSKILFKQNNLLQLFRLTDSYEASYRSFKKVQLLILSSIQSVYKSQGVRIADKHLEIIIKQMTSKIQITRAGDTPLLPHEVIDLYHIRYINQVITLENCQNANYVPILLGITKAALNNPSFISAASFQETTRVLTKAAIEGRCDWLRGLKENIVIGQLIPSGTGCKTYFNFFEQISNTFDQTNFNPLLVKTFESKV
jgi:DNA-directed RNA polymerase subunit beta'